MKVFVDHIVLNDGPLEGAVAQVIARIRRRRVDELAATAAVARR